MLKSIPSLDTDYAGHLDALAKIQELLTNAGYVITVARLNKERADKVLAFTSDRTAERFRFPG